MAVRNDQLTISAGIAAQERNCWELIYPATGLPVEHPDGTRHFASRGEAESWAEGMKDNREDDADSLELREQPGPCWIVTAACGWNLDDELPMVTHHVSAEEALRAALDNDMRISPAGSLICGPDCNDCKQATGDTRPYPSSTAEEATQ